MRLVGLLGNPLFPCPQHVPSPKDERHLSTGLGLMTQANNANLLQIRHTYSHGSG